MAILGQCRDRQDQDKSWEGFLGKRTPELVPLKGENISAAAPRMQGQSQGTTQVTGGLWSELGQGP